MKWLFVSMPGLIPEEDGTTGRILLFKNDIIALLTVDFSITTS